MAPPRKIKYKTARLTETELKKEAAVRRELAEARAEAKRKGTFSAGKEALFAEIDKDKGNLIMQMRLCGMSYPAIAKELGCSSASAVKEVFDRRLTLQGKESTERARAIEMARLDGYLKSIEPLLAVGDLAAIDRALRIQERRAKLLGLDTKAAENPETISQIVKKLRERFPDITEEQARAYVQESQNLVM